VPTQLCRWKKNLLDFGNTCDIISHMKRTNFYFPQEYLDRLAAEAKRTGMPMSEILRRALDEWLREREKKC
jgi:hypothetical protein